jgi:hypothetical protein
LIITQNGQAKVVMQDIESAGLLILPEPLRKSWSGRTAIARRNGEYFSLIKKALPTSKGAFVQTGVDILPGVGATILGNSSRKTRTD